MLAPTLTLLALFGVAIGAMGITRAAAARRPPSEEEGVAAGEWRRTLVGMAGAGAAFFSLAPVPFLSSSAENSGVWVAAGTANVAALVSFNVFIFVRQKRLFGTPFPAGPRAAVAFYIVTAFSFVAAVMNTFGSVLQQGFLGYTLSLASWFYVVLLGALRTLLLRAADRRN